jgi:preprotein translocase subunit SecG
VSIPNILIAIFNVLLLLSSIFLICLVLIQRGKGGGLAGAFGGPGGSSAFGTKAGDVFTRVTIITAIVWFLLAMAQVLLINKKGPSSAFQPGASSLAGEEQPLPGANLGGGTAGAGGAGVPALEGPAAPATTSPATAPQPDRGVEGLPSAIDEPAGSSTSGPEPAPSTPSAPLSGGEPKG